MSGQLIKLGSLSLLYDEGFIRYIKWGDVELVRNIYFALRDSNWTTAPIVRSEEKAEITGKGFDISYTATNVVAGQNVFRWNVVITGNDSGEITFSVVGQALATYNRNRAGICVLHPVRETINKIVKVTRPDGTIYDSRFPEIINPHQPFLDITRMQWELGDGAWAELKFEGDVFETEDQRNWSDTSFKTYSTPLTIPYPVMLKPGDAVSQKVSLKLIDIEKLPRARSKEIEVTIEDGHPTAFPKIGAEFPGVDLSIHKDVGLLADLGFEHLRIELDLRSKSWKEILDAGLAEAKAISTNVFVHLIFGENPASEWEEFAKQKVKLNKLAFSPFDRKANVNDLLNAVLPKARKAYPGVLIGAGFNSYFTELNRNRFDYRGIDFVTYPMTPQAHAIDTLTVIENIPTPKYVVPTAKTFAKGKDVHTGPVSLRPRFNPDAKSEEKKEEIVLPHKYDVRQATALAAGWMIGTIKYLAEGGADAITLFETHGMAGYFMSDNDWHHNDFPTEKIFPVYDAMMSLRKLKPERVVRSQSSNPLACTSLVVENKSDRYLLLVNHTDVGVMVKVRDKTYPVNGWEIHITSINK
ncbi:MAG TPA: hypothetical protein VFE50_25015 [Cyclobacteriaceae bacterium]|nr:hypothetical protein [Cyclobacteriaceae bacterium]